MRIGVLVAILFLTGQASAQDKLVPAKHVISTVNVKPVQYSMNWYFVRDTARYLMGTVATDIQTSNGQLLLVTRVMMKNMKTPWIDSSISRLDDFSPVYHSSYNSQRNMVLFFGSKVSGYYEDLVRKSKKEIDTVVNGLFFDSNMYPYLLSQLPYAEGYTKTISIFDYNPAGKTGVLHAYVKNVKRDTIISQKSGERNVWKVEVSDEIGQGDGSTSIYYIDMDDRGIWKQEILAGSRKMMMIRNE